MPRSRKPQSIQRIPRRSHTTKSYVRLPCCLPYFRTGQWDLWRRPPCTSTGLLTKCRHPFSCSIITVLNHQGEPYINLDRARQRSAWDIGVQKLRQDSDIFRKPPTTCVRPNFISHPSTPPLFHRPSYSTRPAHHTFPACGREDLKWEKRVDVCERTNLTFVGCNSPPLPSPRSSSYDSRPSLCKVLDPHRESFHPITPNVWAIA